MAPKNLIKVVAFLSKVKWLPPGYRIFSTVGAFI